MAIAMTSSIAGSYYKSWTFTAQDADTATSIPHGFGFAPDFVNVQLAVTFASTATPSFATTADATNIYLVKSNTAGSGGLTAGTTVLGRVVAWKPHSLII